MQAKDEKQSSIEKSENSQHHSNTVEQPQGARPKICKPKEAKRRRFVMKQAKTISKPQQLESVSESEESQTLLAKSKNTNLDDVPSTSRRRQEFFGVRSYVHTFYEAMAMDNPHGYEDIETPFGYTMRGKKRRKQVLCWRITLASGLFVLIMGLIALSVGFFVQKRKEVIDTQEDIEIIDTLDKAFNRDLDICKIVGAMLFCIGGLIITGVLLALTIVYKGRIDPLLTDEEIPLTGSEGVTDPGPSALIDVKVPATEEVTAVQPKRMDPDEVVMTNAGLCKAP